MAEIREPDDAVLFVAVLASDENALAAADDALAKHFGPPCEQLPPRPFAFTDYYRAELGDKPLRAFLGYPEPFRTDRLAETKILTNRLEEELAASLALPLPRPVNLDPGYLHLDKLVLASAKNFSHRIHVGRGIYAEITLQYRAGRFQTLPWTFPDYGSGEYDEFFLALRKRLAAQRNPQGKDKKCLGK